MTIEQMDDDEDYKISSELYEENDYSSTSKPIINQTNVVSKFQFEYPPEPPQIDSDGDLVIIRKLSMNQKKIGTIEIEHSKSTILGLVGLQIWRGALLLADWLIYNGNKFKRDNYILELGSGVGLTGIVAAIFSPVLCTDISRGDLLKLIESNIVRNEHLIKYPTKVLELDFTARNLPEIIEKLLPKTSIIIASDVVYDDDITKAFIGTVKKLLSMPPKRSIFIALEKRYVFTIADCDSVAPCYEYFLECLGQLDNVDIEEIPLDFPQYFNYERVKELVLWRISSKFN